MTVPTGTRPLDAYRAALGSGWDELVSGDGDRPGQRILADAVASLGHEGLLAARDDLAGLVRDEGIDYGGERRRSWAVDPLPVILGADEWEHLERGLAQRARLLGLILADIYGDQRLLSSGAIAPEIVWGHPGFLPQACGIQADTWLPLVATDLGRAPDGQWTALADRTATPAGAGYAMANRRLTSRVLGDLHHDARPARLSSYFSALRTGLRQLAPGQTPKGVLLWAGSEGETAYEQGFLATLLGYALVEAEDLLLRDGHVFISAPEGRTQVDVILRRVDSELSDPLEFRSDSQQGLAGLLEAARLGNVVTVNPLGSDVLENPALFGLLPTLAPQLLGEELLLPSPQTWWCGDPTQRDHVLGRLDTVLIKPLRGVGTVAGWELSDRERDDLRARIETAPWAWCGQEAVEVSTSPVVTRGGLEPRRTVLRCFGVQVDHGHEFLPGGLARAAGGDGFTITNARGSHAKDVWVLDPDDASEAWLTRPDETAVLVRHAGTLAPRVADNLYWLGRYAERADANARLLRLALTLTRDHGRRPGSRGAQVLAAVLDAGERVTGLDLGSGDIATAHRQLRSAVADPDVVGSLAHVVRRLTAAAHEAPDLMSGDLWHVLGRLESLVDEAARRRDLTGLLDGVTAATLAIAGINAESLTRDATWGFVDAGVRTERAQRMLGLLGSTLREDRAAVVEYQLADAVVELGESLITHRRRSAAGEAPRLAPLAATHLLVCEAANPRSVAFQVARLTEALALIGDAELSDEAAALGVDLASLDLPALFAGPRPALGDALFALRDRLRDLSVRLDRRHLTRTAPRRALVTGWSSESQGER